MASAFLSRSRRSTRCPRATDVARQRHVNSTESFFALLKRGVHGTFHHVSKQHLQRYCHEFAFRWDWRKMTDGDRAAQAIRGAEGKRLMYTSPAEGQIPA